LVDSDAVAVPVPEVAAASGVFNQKERSSVGI
jgi:hypothetical protein